MIMITFLMVWSLLWASASTHKIPNHEALYDSSPDAFKLLAKGIDAIGGRSLLKGLRGVSYESALTLVSKLYRTQGMMQSYTPGYADQSIATSGSQTVHFDLSNGPSTISQRIDRAFNVDQYWIFFRPLLQPFDASLVVHTGSNGSACYVKGNEFTGTPPEVTWGYTDAALTSYLQREASRFSPTLLLAMEQDAHLTKKQVIRRGHSYPSIYSPRLGFTILLDPDTFLPYVIRVNEYHEIFGQSTSDLVLYNYTSVGGIEFPQRCKIAYNEVETLVDTLFSNVTVNPDFNKGFFDSLPLNAINDTVTQLGPAVGNKPAAYGDAQVFEFSTNTLWSGLYSGHLLNVTVTNPVPSIPDLYYMVFNDSPGYASTIAVTEDAIMVVDAPPHQSLLVIEWIEKKFNRKPTHLLVTHHHHDHNYGAADYAAVGAKLVVPEDYAYYWSAIPHVRFQTVSQRRPFVHISKSMQIRAVWPGNKNVHALDWMYFVFSEARPNNNSTLAIAEADAWNANFFGDMFDQRLATEFLNILEQDGMPHNSVVLPVHGSPANMTELCQLTDYDYPNFTIGDFNPGGRGL